MSIMMKDLHDDEKEQGSILPFHEPSSILAPSIASDDDKKNTQFNMRAEIAAFIGELIGTFMFLSMAFTAAQIAVNAASGNTLKMTGSPIPLPNLDKLLYIAFAFSMSLAVNVAIFADVSGAKFNPAVTLSLLLTQKIHWHRAISTIPAQLLASIASSFFVSSIVPGALTIDTKLDPSISLTRGLFIETFATFQLILTILMLEGSTAKPMYIGLALFITQLSAVQFTGGSLNPARSFGPACVNGFPSEHWVYWIGPVMGAALASAVFVIVGWVRRERY